MDAIGSKESINLKATNDGGFSVNEGFLVGRARVAKSGAPNLGIYGRSGSTANLGRTLMDLRQKLLDPLDCLPHGKNFCV